MPTFSDRDAYLQHIKAARPVVPKEDLIVDLCRGRSVLDIGCIDHSADTALELGESWLHRRIRGVATELVGLDLLADEAARLNALGYDIRVGDATKFDLGRTFDIVVAGDIIEHLADIGLFLQSIHRHLHADSRVIITTPNPFNIEQAARVLFIGEPRVHEEHVVWIDPTVMWELATREGYAIERFEWIDTRFDFSFESTKRSARAVNRLLGLAMRRRPMTRRDYAVVLAPR